MMSRLPPTAQLTSLSRSLPTCPVPGFSGLPVFVAGCSLGGCIAVNAIHREGALFKGAALFAPMLSLERASQHGLNYYLRHALAAPRRNMDVVHCQAGLSCMPIWQPSLGALLARPTWVLNQQYPHGRPARHLHYMCSQGFLTMTNQSVSLKGSPRFLHRPLASVLSRVAPSLPAASTTKNDLYPELQALWDSGERLSPAAAACISTELLQHPPNILPNILQRSKEACLSMHACKPNVDMFSHGRVLPCMQ